MPGYPLTLPGAVHGMVAHLVTLLSTGWTRAIPREHWLAKSVPQGSNKLRGPKEEAKTWRRHYREPVT